MPAEEDLLKEIFDGFPDPVLLVREGSIAYSNPAAGRYPALRPGARVPWAPAGTGGGPRLLMGALEGRPCRVHIQPLEAGLLLTVRVEEEGAPVPEGVTFQLRQEMAGLSAALQRIAAGGDGGREEQQRKYLAAANQGLCRLLRLTGHLELLDGREEEGSRPVLMDLAGFCRDLCRQAEEICRRAGLPFTYQVEEATLLTMGDAALLTRLLLELLSNALRAAGREGRVGLRLSRRQDRAEIVLWNDGAAPDLGRLFQGPGAPPPLEDPGAGLGLGLSAARQIALLHGGTLVLEAGSGGGLRAVLSLPVRKGEESLPLRAPQGDYSGGLPTLLVELSNVLPAALYAPEEMEELR